MYVGYSSVLAWELHACVEVHGQLESRSQGFLTAPASSAQQNPCLRHARLPEMLGFSKILGALIPIFPLELFGQHLVSPTIRAFSNTAVLKQLLFPQDSGLCVRLAVPQLTVAQASLDLTSPSALAS